jgi:uncharacterized protein (TIGR00251 family)
VIAIIPHAEGVILPVVAQPGARRNAVLGERAGALRIAVTAPPDKGKANAAIQSVLAESLGCKAAQVSLISGAASRQKRFLIRGIDPQALRDRLSDITPATQKPAPQEATNDQ